MSTLSMADELPVGPKLSDIEEYLSPFFVGEAEDEAEEYFSGIAKVFKKEYGNCRLRWRPLTDHYSIYCTTENSFAFFKKVMKGSGLSAAAKIAPKIGENFEAINDWLQTPPLPFLDNFARRIAYFACVVHPCLMFLDRDDDAALLMRTIIASVKKYGKEVGGLGLPHPDSPGERTRYAYLAWLFTTWGILEDKRKEGSL